MLRVKRPSNYHKLIYVAAFLLTLHYGFTLYINSNFLSQFFSSEHVSLLYVIGSCLTILGLAFSSRLVKKFGNTNILLCGLILEFIALVGLMSTHSLMLLNVFFLMHQALPPLLLFSFDFMLESTIGSESTTGRVRSLYLTTINTAILLSPFVAGYIISHSAYSYRTVYLASATFIALLFLLVVSKLKKVPARKILEVDLVHSIRHFSMRACLARIFSVNFLLQSFYALMVIYMPIYLHQIIGFNWERIGLIFTVMLIPFVVFEAPLGRIFDSLRIERDTLIAGFLIMAGATYIMFMTHSTSILFWMLLLLVSRIGASFVEVSSEYSFFYRVNEQDSEFISIFRMTEPLSYVIAPIVASLFIFALPLNYIFLLITFLMLVGIVLSYNLQERHKIRAPENKAQKFSGN